ncbi:thioredoxin-dependent thiol peroxidase [uncultured Limimaricola sp.]|uniref:thioredoxin-dependent thiol peroxidase n=1 Tax=uncultured Limimaricola sp. TaxID=2211667 RepID=UPI0030FBE973
MSDTMSATRPEPGQTAPEFSLPRDGGEEVRLSAHLGAPVVVYFYPRDDTSGCTKQAQGFSDLGGEFELLGARVLGVSKDTVGKHEKFRDKYALKVALLSDAESDVCERYGVWVEKKMYGKTFMGIERTTFLIDAQGHVARVWPRVKVAGHAEEVLDAVRAL